MERKHKKYISLTCKWCLDQYQTFVEPSGRMGSKVFCGKKCRITAMKCGLFREITKENMGEKNNQSVFWTDTKEESRMFCRFVSAYEDGVEEHCLIERFGLNYKIMIQSVPKESREIRKKSKQITKSEARGLPKILTFNTWPNSRNRKRIKSSQRPYYPKTNGLLWASGNASYF